MDELRIGGRGVPIQTNQIVLDSGTSGIVLSEQDATTINGVRLQRFPSWRDV